MKKQVEDFKTRFNKAITKKDMKAVELSEKSGISKSTISHYMSGYTKPKSDKLYVLAKVLDVNEAWLMGYDVPMERNYGREETILKPRDERDIGRRLEQTLSDLQSNQVALMFDGEAIDDETRELLKASLEHSIRVAKINAKKFTPKKYLDTDNQGK